MDVVYLGHGLWTISGRHQQDGGTLIAVKMFLLNLVWMVSLIAFKGLYLFLIIPIILL